MKAVKYRVVETGAFLFASNFRRTMSDSGCIRGAAEHYDFDSRLCRMDGGLMCRAPGRGRFWTIPQKFVMNWA
jgi:hypothetical protein